jgi:nicotinamidase-related amidase
MAQVNPVLLVVDMQNGFLGQKSQHVIPNVVRLVEELKKRAIPVVFTRFHNEPGSQYERLIGWTRLRSSPEVDITSELTPFADVVIDKSVYTSFVPEFARLVSENNWSTIIICGVATDGCVLKTATDAFEQGLTPIVVEDACASHAGEEVHRAGLLLTSRFIGKGQIVNTSALLERIDDSNYSEPR